MAQVRAAWVPDTRLVPFYLMANYLYYHRAVSLFPDPDYDTLCRRLLAAWPKVRHPHKGLFTKADLRAGTGYTMAEDDYPLQVRGAATHLAGLAGLL